MTTAGSGGVPHCPPGAHVQNDTLNLRRGVAAEGMSAGTTPGPNGKHSPFTILHLFTIDRPALPHVPFCLLLRRRRYKTANRYVTVFYIRSKYRDGLDPRRPRHLEKRCRGAAAGPVGPSRGSRHGNIQII